MTNRLTLSAGLMLRLKKGFARNRWTVEQIERLSEGAFLKGVLDVLECRAEIRAVEGIVDLDAAPFVPEGYGWTVHEGDQLSNRARGTIDIKKVGLHLATPQKTGVIVIRGLRKDFADKLVLNANVLDFLLEPENQRLIPKEWKGKDVFFWGTIYRRGDGNLYVRYLCWLGDRWRWNYYWLNDVLHTGNLSAVLASSA